MNRVDRFERRDWIAAAVLFAVSLGLRVPFRSEYAYNWDCAEFTIAVRDYNVALSQPHAPGYFLYVMLGRLLDFLVRNPHASLVWLSVGSGSLLVGLVYLLGAAMFGRRTGATAGLLVLTSPQVWFHSCVALTYIVSAALVCMVVLACWRAANRGGSWKDIIWIAVLLAFCAGVRPQSAMVLAPLVAFTFCRFHSNRLAKAGVAFTITLALCTIWFSVMMGMSRGLPTFLEAERRNLTFNSTKTLAGGGWPAFMWNATFAGASSWSGLTLGVIALLGGLVHRVLVSRSDQRNWRDANSQAIRMLAVWVGSMFGLTTIVGFTDQPGHAIDYLAGLIILTAATTTQIECTAMRRAVAVATCIVNTGVFLIQPPSQDAWFLGMARTAQHIRRHDKAVEQTVQIIRARFKPGQTVLYHGAEDIHFGLRQFQLWLPEFEQFQMAYDPVMLSPKDRPVLAVSGGQLVFARRQDVPRDRMEVLLVPPGKSVEIFSSYFDLTAATAVDGWPNTVYTFGGHEAGGTPRLRRDPNAFPGEVKGIVENK